MKLEETDSFSDAKPFWEELNRTYKRGELTVDWDIHQQLWQYYYRNKGYSLKVLLGFEKRRCVGIIPFKYRYSTTDPQQSWIFGEESIIAREFFTAPNKIHQFVPYFPAHSSTDLSCFYTPEYPHFFVRRPGRIIDICTSEDSYLRSLN